MIEYQKHYNDTSSHRLSEPYNKTAYANRIMQHKGINTSNPLFKKMTQMVEDRDRRRR